MAIIYTLDEAAKIVELFEDLLDKYDISVPSPEDDERESENTAKLYGSTYGELLDKVEYQLQDILSRAKPTVVSYEFSGGW